MKNIYRHGDFIFSPIKEIKDATKATKDALGKNISTSFTFGVGEATGHNHVAVIDNITKATWYRAKDGGWYVDFREKATLTHPEHSLVKDLEIPKGVYKVYQAREKDWFSLAVRRVID